MVQVDDRSPFFFAGLGLKVWGYTHHGKSKESNTKNDMEPGLFICKDMTFLWNQVPLLEVHANPEHTGFRV